MPVFESTTQFLISFHFACAILYNDETGLEDGDSEKLELFMGQFENIVTTMELGSATNANLQRCEITNLDSECIVLNVHFHKAEVKPEPTPLPTPLVYTDLVTAEVVTEVTEHYILCAVWADGADGDEGISEFGDNAIAVSTADVHKFLLQAEPFLPDFLTTQTISQIGHDFWLTRNGHGAGFWDRDLGALGSKLSALAESFGEVHLFLHEDNEHAEYEID